MWWRWIYPVRLNVIVNTKTDKAFRGVLWRHSARHLVLKNTEMLRPREGPLTIDGEVVIERTNVDFVQVLGE